MMSSDPDISGPFRGAQGRATGPRVGPMVARARLSARRSAPADFLVDTGATHSIVPPALARKVGAPTLPQRFEVSLADGGRRRLKACSMSVSVAGRTGPTIALLLPGSDPLLGVETLEALGLKVNPEGRRLEPSRSQTALLVDVRAAASRSDRQRGRSRRHAGPCAQNLSARRNQAH